MPDFKQYAALLKKLGRHKKSVSCLYVNNLSDIHVQTLKKIIKESVREMRKRYPDAKTA